MSKIFKKKIKVPIYNIDIELYYGDMENILPIVQGEFSSALMIDEYTAAYTTLAERKHNGVFSKKIVIIISTGKESLFVIHHESIHAAMFILQWVGVKITQSKHEELCYLVTYIAESINDNIFKWQNNKKEELAKDI